MVFDKSELISILKNSYRKLKNHIHFSNNLEYVKKDIADFEFNSDVMENTFERLAEALINENDSYFSSLLNKIKTRVFAKSFKENSENSYIISNVKDERIVLSKVNFFINAPIELLIIDTFWSLMFAHVLNQDKDYHRFCYANKIHHELFKRKKTLSPLSATNFKSLSFFEEYYYQYVRWKNDAVTVAKNIHGYNQNRNDVSIVCFDLLKFYYSVNIDFDSIKTSMVSTSPSLSQFGYLSILIERMYKHYSLILRKHDRSIEENQTVLPIGLISSSLLSNYYLLAFDKKIAGCDSVYHYGRYVDDVLIVIKSASFDSFEELIKEFFSEQFIAKEDKYYLKGFFNVSIQKTKTKIIKIKKEGSTNILDKLSVEIHPSEPRLFPSYKIDIKEFLNDITSKDEIMKIRDTNSIKINVKKLVSAINGYINLRKCTIEDTTKSKTKKETIEETQLEKLIELLSSGTLLTIYTRWNKLFLFAYLHNNGEEIARRLKNNIKSGLNKIELELEDKDYCDCEYILQLLKKEYREMVCFAEASYRAIVGVKNMTTKETKLAARLRRANLIDFNAIAIPMSNYLRDLPLSYNLTSSTDYRELSELTNNTFDNRLLLYSPRFIGLSDFLYFKQMSALYGDSTILFEKNHLSEYYQIANDIFGVTKNPIQIKEDKSTKEIYSRYDFEIEDKYLIGSWYSKGIYVGLANINLYRHKILKGKKKQTLDLTGIYSPKRKRELLDLLNECHITQTTYYYYFDSRKRNKLVLASTETTKRPVSFLVFPETYLPIYWIPTLVKYAKNSGAVVVSGIKYLQIGNRIVNLQVVIIPFTTSDYHRQALVLLREKNNYAPFEKEIIINSGKTFLDHLKPVYYTFKHRNIFFSTFICYELTDIFARALVRNKSEIVFSSEYNKDIHYFSNIVESASRDLSAFVVQVNSSECGDTRIIAPYRDKFKNIANITGGEKDSVHIGKIDLAQQRDYMKKYRSHSKDCKYSSLDEDEKYEKNKKPSAGTH